MLLSVNVWSRRHFFNPLPPPPSPGVCRPTNQNPSRPHPVSPSPGVAAAPQAAAVAEEEQQGEQDQRPPGEDAQQHQQQHIVLHLARRHGHILVTSSRETRFATFSPCNTNMRALNLTLVWWLNVEINQIIF